MAATADIYEDQDRLRGTLALSVALHVALFGGALAYAAFLGGIKGESWGGTGMGGGAMSATLVTSIPLPTPANPSANILANESKGVSQSLPKPAEKVEEPEAVPIPEKPSRTKKQSKAVTPTKEPAREPVEAADNVVPFGQGGQVSLFHGPSGTGGLSFGPPGGGGDFGSRYGWYVDTVRRKISENWLKYEVDPRISAAHRVYITFEIDRSGRPGRIQVEQSSGVPALDDSARRALQRIDTFGPLPGDYRGGSVAVEFYFDYQR